MYTGTMIEDLIATVARAEAAEEKQPRRPVYIEPKVINGGLTWGFVYEQPLEQLMAGVA